METYSSLSARLQSGRQCGSTQWPEHQGADRAKELPRLGSIISSCLTIRSSTRAAARWSKGRLQRPVAFSLQCGVLSRVRMSLTCPEHPAAGLDGRAPSGSRPSEPWQHVLSQLCAAGRLLVCRNMLISAVSSIYAAAGQHLAAWRALEHM